MQDLPFERTVETVENVPFPKTDKTIHAYYCGKTGMQNDVIGLLLNALSNVKDKGLTTIVSGTSRTPLKLVEDPICIYGSVCAQPKNQLRNIKYEGNDVYQMEMRFFECTNESYIDIVVHYDMGPTKRALLAVKATLPSAEIQDLQTAVAEAKASAHRALSSADKAQVGVKTLELKSDIIVKDVAALEEKFDKLTVAVHDVDGRVNTLQIEVQKIKAEIAPVVAKYKKEER